MPTVWIPPQLRKLTHEQESLAVAGSTLAELIDALETRFPGSGARLVENGAVRSGLSVVIDGQVSREGLSAQVQPNSEVHFIPAIGGG